MGLETSGRKTQSFVILPACRGQHCPICGTYLCVLARLLSPLGKRGVECLTRAVARHLNVT